MDVREKLIDLLHLVHVKVADLVLEDNEKTYSDAIGMEADHLIANGVTVQEWISVDERMPEDGGYVVCIAKRNPFSRFMPMVARIEKNGWANPITEQYISEVTHWMPLPEPPKGE